MKTFIYYVGEHSWESNEPWGEAWQQAKAFAQEVHGVIYRDVIKAGKIRHEVFYEGEVFNIVNFTYMGNVKIW